MGSRSARDSRTSRIRPWMAVTVFAIAAMSAEHPALIALKREENRVSHVVTWDECRRDSPTVRLMFL